MLSHQQRIAQRILAGAVASAALVALSSVALADSVTLEPTKDNTLINVPGSGNSNALGSLYSGRTGPMGRTTELRCVMAFNVADSIPAGSVINSATLRLRLEQTSSGAQTMTLHKLLADWGEGQSAGGGGQGGPATPGDATWNHSFFDTQFWTNPGGDFNATASASQVVEFDLTSDYVWTSPQMATDVQSWLDAPATSFGWLLLGNETGLNTTKKFFSRESPTAELRPRLVIDFTPPTINCPPDVNNSGAVDVDDLIEVILSWGSCPKPPAACDADVNDSGAVDVDDLIAVILGWGDCP